MGEYDRSQSFGSFRINMKQHFVPQCYLKAWCDSATPRDQEPYVWRFSKNGLVKKKKAPRKIFRETDMYTIQMPDGSRDYVLERGLHDLEDIFIRIRDEKIKLQLPLTVEEHILLLTFLSALHNRTKSQRDHHKNQWNQVLDLMDSIKRQMEEGTPEERKAIESITNIPSPASTTLSYEEVKKLVAEPMLTMLLPKISAEVPLLHRLSLTIITTELTPGFITSDRPCIWFDSEAYKRPPLLRSPGLINPMLEITLPISPSQLVILTHQLLPEGYIKESRERMVEEFNRRTRFCCDEYFIVNQDLVKGIWFDTGKEPDDSWEKTHKQ